MPHCLFARTSVRADSLLVQLLAAGDSQLTVRASGVVAVARLAFSLQSNLLAANEHFVISRT